MAAPRRLASCGVALAALVAAVAPSWAAAPRARRPAHPGGDHASPGGGAWLEAITQGLQREEYQISPRRGESGFSAPNRANDFRTTWDRGVVTVSPRVDEGAWSFSFGLVDPRPLNWEAVEGGRLEWGRGDAMREWYLNDERGIEQGFTLESRPAAARAGAPVSLDLHVEGLLLYPTEDGGAVMLRAARGKDVMRIGHLHVMDARGQTLAACFDVGPSTLSIIVDDRSAQYPIDIDPLMTSPAWTVEGDQADALLGYAVSTAGDVNGDGFSDVVVGADGYDSGQASAGRAMVFLGSATGLATTPAWTVDGDQADGAFGIAAGTAGDVNGDGFSDLLVGAAYYDNGEVDEGRAYCYHGSAAGLSTTPAWTAEADQDGAIFGWPVTTAGDVNGDGFADVLVTAYAWSGADIEEGICYVYHGSSAGLEPTPRWTVEGNQNGAFLGVSGGTAGDVNGDGFADVIVSAYYFDDDEIDEGRAYCYHGSATGLSRTPAWTADGNQDFAAFGFAVSTAGDVNGDGYSDVIVGAAYYQHPLPLGEGRAVVYHGSASGLAATPAWTLESQQPDAHLGAAVANAGDVNGDGYADVLVGAPGQNAAGADAGRASLHLGSAAGLSPTEAWAVDGDQFGAQLGVSVATAGDVNGDGWSDVLVGEWQRDGSGVNEGRALAFLGGASGLAMTPAWSVEGEQADAAFGTSVASAGDVNGDGYSDVIVGAAYYDDGEIDEGRALAYFGSASGLSTTAAWTAEGDQDAARFGKSVATAGDVNGDGYSDVIVGASRYTNGQAFQGRALVYTGSPTGLSAAAAWTADGDQDSELLGTSVATAGDVNGDGYSDVIVGAPDYGNSEVYEGRALMYLGSASGLMTTAAWTAESDQSGARFGLSVATAGDVNGDGYSDAIVGANTYENGQVVEGRVYVYHGAPSGLAMRAAWTAEGDQATAQFGVSVSTAGDVNGDGYSDVIVGAFGYDNGQGRAFAYHGSASGLSTTPAWTAGSNQADALFGCAVAVAGDVNGDGFSDVIVGAEQYSDGQATEGRAFAYFGSASGISAVPTWMAETDQAFAYFGHAVAPAGDVNGDGYSDVIVGALVFDDGENDEGAAFLYYGNGGDGLDRIPRQRRFDDSAPIDMLGATTTANGFLVTANGCSPYGRDRVRLEIEVEPLGVPFDALGIESSAFTDTGAPGVSGSVVRLSVLHPSLTIGAHHWRARLRGTFPFPWQSHWMGMPLNNLTETDLRVPGINPVTCDAGPPQSGCAGAPGVVTLDGSGSSGPGPLTFAWSSAAPEVSIVSPSLAVTDVNIAGVGVFVVRLSLTSGADSATCVTTVSAQDALPPLLACAPEIRATPDRPLAALVSVTASATDDCDPAVVVTNDRTAGGADASDVYACGETIVIFSARDAAGNLSTCETTVTVAEATAPLEISATGIGPPLRVSKDPASQEIHVAFEDRAAPNELLSLYAGTIRPAALLAYDHAPVTCKVTAPPAGPGIAELVAPWDAGSNRYYLVSASNCLGESPRGFDSALVRHPALPTDCGALP